MDSTINNTPPPEITPSQNNIEKKPAFVKTKKGKIITAGIILLVAVILLITLSMMLSRPNPTTTSNNKSLDTANQKAYTYPPFEFTYKTPDALPQTPQTFTEYALKESFTASDLATLAAQFGLKSPVDVENDTALFSNTTDPGTRGTLTVNTKTGAFEYQNFGSNTKVAGDIKSGSKTFLQSLGLTDNNIECDITYENKLSPGVRYVECHRSWTALGAPLFNTPGLLNITENVKLSELKLGENYTPISNPDIINVSTGQNLEDRPNDFNTATFALATDGTILSLSSNFRWIVGQKATEIISPSEALANLSGNKNTSTIAVPSGYGQFDWNRVFPDRTVTGKDAEINSLDLVYVENLNSQSQKSYTPTFVVRGNVMLDTGYKVNFVQTVPAAKNSLANSAIADDSRNNLQIETFSLPTRTPTTVVTATPIVTLTPETTITVTPKPTTTVPLTVSPSPTVTTSIDCKDAGLPNTQRANLTEHTVRLPDGGVVVLSATGGSNTFWVKSATQTDTRITSLREQFYKLIANQFIYNYTYKRDTYSNFHTVKEYGSLVNFYNYVPQADYEMYAPPYNLGVQVGTRPMIPLHVALRQDYEKRVKAIDDGTLENLQDPNLPGHLAWIIRVESTETNTCYLTGSSPTIFLTSEIPTLFKVSPTHTLYSDPSLFKNSWTTLANSKGIQTVNDKDYNFLYYEFNPRKVSFENQEAGIVTERGRISELINKLATSMRLTATEKERLKFEINHALSSVNPKLSYIKVSLVPERELNAKLPLSVSPKPEYTNRYHFLVKGLSRLEKSKPLTIPEVVRKSSTLLEIGASEVK